MIGVCLFWQPQPELQQSICRIATKILAPEPRSRTGMVWGGRGFAGPAPLPACSPSCTHSQELEIFQPALFTTLAKLFIQNIMNVPVVHKQTCLFLSTWNGNFLCSPSGRILHCYYKRWVNPWKWGKTAHVQLSRKKKKRCTSFFWSAPMSAAWTMIFVIHLRSIWTSIPFFFLYNCDLTSVISFCCTRSFAVQDHVYFLSSLERTASKVILSMFLCIVQSLELGGYLYIGDIGIKIYLFFLRSETARRQVTEIVHLKMSDITCSVFAYWIYSLWGWFLILL